MKNVRSPHILHTLAIFLVFLRNKFFLGFLKELEIHILKFFLVFLRSNFFPDFLKELQVHIVSMDDYKVEYDPK